MTNIETDSAGLLLHLSTCGVTDGVDSDEDCTCGAHAMNVRLNALRAENQLARTTIDAQSKAVLQLSAENERLRAALTKIADSPDVPAFGGMRRIAADALGRSNCH